MQSAKLARQLAVDAAARRRRLQRRQDRQKQEAACARALGVAPATSGGGGFQGGHAVRRPLLSDIRDKVEAEADEQRRVNEVLWPFLPAPPADGCMSQTTSALAMYRTRHGTEVAERLGSCFSLEYVANCCGSRYCSPLINKHRSPLIASCPCRKWASARQFCRIGRQLWG